MVLLLVLVTSVPVRGERSAPLFVGPPVAPSDEIFLVSTRQVGTRCNGEAMQRGLQCLRYRRVNSGTAAWQPVDWQALARAPAPERATVIYVHGNRVASGEDRAEGLSVYRSAKSSGRFDGPVRWIIWSWPSAPLPGPIKDYRIKASRTRPVAWQLAWFLDQLPAQGRVALVGYSYGARIVSGAAHILAGGNLDGLRLGKRKHPQRAPLRVALVAAAYDAIWIQPRNYYGRSISQIERLVLATNVRDPAMRYYHLSNGRGRMEALGKFGILRPAAFGSAARRVRQVDFAGEVGRSHALHDYLAAAGKMSLVWRELAGSAGLAARDEIAKK